MAQRSLFPEVAEIIRILRRGERQDLVILIVPSHDQKEKELKNQDMWAGEAMELFKDLFGGATAFTTFAGIYLDAEGRTHHDKPILVESYVSRESLEDERRLTTLVQFIKRMGRDTRQKAVGLIVNDVFHGITNFKSG
jgi:hypothetical protein